MRFPFVSRAREGFAQTFEILAIAVVLFGTVALSADSLRRPAAAIPDDPVHPDVVRYYPPFTARATQFEVASSQFADTGTELQSANTDFSVCAWVTPATIPMNGGGPGNDGIITASGTAFGQRLDDAGKQRTYIGGVSTVDRSTTAISVGERAFVCSTFDDSGSDTDVTWYLNGAADGTSNRTERLTVGTDGFAVGATGVSGAAQANGDIGPVFVWDDAVASAGEISTLYANGIGLSCSVAARAVTTLDHCWMLEENGGPYVDAIGSADLTAQGTPVRVFGMVADP